MSKYSRNDCQGHPMLVGDSDAMQTGVSCMERGKRAEEQRVVSDWVMETCARWGCSRDAICADCGRCGLCCRCQGGEG
jgi:hypothetical protein